MTPALFNSLGSNYSASFVARSARLLLSPRRWRRPHPQTQVLRDRLAQAYPGDSTFFSQGRQALTYILKNLPLKPDDQVLTQALTCKAVEQGILDAGAVPVYADVASGSLNLSLETLKQAFARSTRPKAILLQHTLGYPVDADAIRQWSKQHGLFLIQDLAHAAFAPSLTRLDPSDAVLLSFGRDKILDAVTGGAAILPPLSPQPLKRLQTLSQTAIARSLFYPSLTYLIRSTYPFYLGKPINYLAKNLGCLPSPVTNASAYPTLLPEIFSPLIMLQLDNLVGNLKRRRRLARLYHRQLSAPSTLVDLRQINSGTNLRYPLLVANRPHFLEYLKHHHMHLSDVWYRQPVDSGRLSYPDHYQSGTCPQAEAVAAHLVNLPTHRHASTQAVNRLISAINQYREPHVQT